MFANGVGAIGVATEETLEVTSVSAEYTDAWLWDVQLSLAVSSGMQEKSVEPTDVESSSSAGGGNGGGRWVLGGKILRISP